MFTTHLINERRLRNYPRLMLMGLWGVLLATLVLHQGWTGGMGQIIGSNFITLYAAGLLYRLDIGHLYDLATRGSVQQALIRPTPLPGVNPYISPPYVAWAYGRLTFLPLIWALLLWVLLTFLFAVLAVHLGTRSVASPWLVRAGLTRSRSGVLDSVARVAQVSGTVEFRRRLDLRDVPSGMQVKQMWTSEGKAHRSNGS